MVAPRSCPPPRPWACQPLPQALPDPPVPQFPRLSVLGPNRVWVFPAPSLSRQTGSHWGLPAASRLLPWVFPLIPQAGLPPLSARLSAKALAAVGGVWGWCQDTVSLSSWKALSGPGVAGRDTGPGPAVGAGRSELRGGGSLPALSLSAPGATSAPCLIFIFPAIFYIRIMPKDKEPLRSTPKILVSVRGGRDRGRGSLGSSLTRFPVPTGCLLCPARRALHGHELELHHHRLGHGRGEERRQPLASSGCPCQPPPPPTGAPGRAGPRFSPRAMAWLGFPRDLLPSLPISWWWW